MKELHNIDQNQIATNPYENTYYPDQKPQPGRVRAKAKKDQQAMNGKAELLSNKEVNTLHMLFGSKMPEEMQFYGQNKVKTIHKGQFIDLKG